MKKDLLKLVLSGYIRFTKKFEINKKRNNKINLNCLKYIFSSSNKI